MFNIITAVGPNAEIGYKGKLPWHVPEDLKFFKEKTENQMVIMGRKTYEGLDKRLPNRYNFVLTNNKLNVKTNFSYNGIHYGNIDTLFWLITHLKKDESIDQMENWIIGGASIYELFLTQYNHLVKTVVMSEINIDGHKADTYFPYKSMKKFELENVVRLSDRVRVCYWKNINENHN